ncbi:hypothetical protein OIU79_028420 [Salix purpurea]|uniref:CCAAT-binding factor domain-containing protein n=1 Tax=Salix purpurea TaxID=77065 RepID=A0A9Q0VWS2_SALPP|nr:hypothetical protein OIU79_028420 [Salix purpurea]
MSCGKTVFLPDVCLFVYLICFFILHGKTESGDKVGDSDSREILELSICKIHYIISNIPPLEDAKQDSDYELWGGSGFSVKKGEAKGPSHHLKTEDKDLKSEKHDNDSLSAGNYAKKMKLKFTKAWISFLRLPNFYEKLYVLLLPSIFMAKHRAKFFQLLDSCLKSPLLPAYLATAFAKKLRDILQSTVWCTRVIVWRA